MAFKLLASRVLSRPAACCAGGVLTLSLATSTTAQATEMVPPFSLDKSRYDMSTYGGRLKNIIEMIDVRTVFTSSAELEGYQKLLEQFKNGTAPPGTTDEDLWKAKRIVGAIIHPATGEPMMLVGRMSMFVPMNVPIAFGMLSASTPVTNLFWQWLNQSYNVLNNYTCRAGKDVEWPPLLKAYGLAVSVSVGISVGASILSKRFVALQKLGPVIPYLAVISAGTSNVAFTRMDEIENGIPISDSTGRELGVSVEAGKTAVFKTVTTRSMFLPIFPLLVPPAVMGALYKAGAFAPKTGAAMVSEVAVIAACMSFALPCALAIQPPVMSLDVNSLEDEFQGLQDAEGNPITVVYAQKGL